MAEFDYEEQDGGLPILTKKSTAPAEDNGLPILKKKVDGNVSATGGANTVPLPSTSTSVQKEEPFNQSNFLKQLGADIPPELQTRHDEVLRRQRELNNQPKNPTPLQRFDNMAAPILGFNRDLMQSVNPKKVAEIDHDVNGHWGNIVQNVFANLEKAGTKAVSGVANILRDAGNASVNPASLFMSGMGNDLYDKKGELTQQGKEATYKDDFLGKLIIGLNGNEQRMNNVLANNKLPNTFLGNATEAISSFAPDIAATALVPESKLAQGAGVLAKAGRLLFNPFTKVMLTKGAIEGYGEARDEGKSIGEATIGGLKGGAEGAKTGIEMALLGAGSSLATKGIMAKAAEKGLVGAKGIATKELVNLATDVTAYGLVAPTVHAGIEGRFPTMKEISDGTGIATLFRVKGGLENARKNGELNKALEETQNLRQGAAISNFVDADHAAIEAVQKMPEAAEELNLKALEFAKKAKDETDLSKKQEYVAKAITYTKASNVKSVADMVLNNPQGLEDFKNSQDIPDQVKQQFLQKAQEVTDLLNPKDEVPRGTSENVPTGNIENQSPSTKEEIADEIAKQIYPSEVDSEYRQQGRKKVIENPISEVERMIDHYEKVVIPRDIKENSSLLKYSEENLNELKQLKERYLNAEKQQEPSTENEHQKELDILSNPKVGDVVSVDIGGGNFEKQEIIAVNKDGVVFKGQLAPTPIEDAIKEVNAKYKNETIQDKVQQPTEAKSDTVAEVSENSSAAKSSKGIIKKATSIEDLTEPRDIVLQHFAGGGKIHSDAVKELFGGKDDRIRQNASTENEKRARIGLLSKDGKGIDELAHSLWEADKTGKYTTQDYKEAIEQVLQDHNSTGSMARELVDKYIENGKSELTDSELEEVDKIQQQKINKQLEKLDADTQEELFDLLKKYQDQYGNIDWEKLNEDTNGFDPDILNLSENTQKQLYELIDSKLKGQDELSNPDIEGESGTPKEAENNANAEPPTADNNPEANTDEGGRTGIKNKVSNETRVHLQLPSVEVPKLGKDVAVLHEGKKLVDEGIVNPQEVVNRIISTDNHNMNRDEAKAMQYYMHQLGRAQDLVNEQLSQDVEPTEKLELISQQQQLSDLQDAATEANIKAGKDWSDVGNIRQILVDKSFNPSREKAIIKEAYGGEVPKEVKEKLDATIKERDEAVAARTKVEEQLRETEAKLKIAEMKKGAEKGVKKDHKANRAALIDELKQAKAEHDKWLKDNGIQQQGIGGFALTPKMVKIIGKIAADYVHEGYEKVEDLVNRVYEEVKSIIPGVDKKDIRDSIALYEAEKLDAKGERLEGKKEGMIFSNDFDAAKPKLKPKFERNNDWVKANQRVLNAEYKIRKLKNEALNSQKNAYQKALMWASKLVRASVLSGTNVLYKLASAATIGGAGKRIPEQVIGQIYSNVFKGIAEKAPIEGFSNAKAEAKFYKEFFNPKKFVQNTWQILKSGASNLTKKMDGRMNDDLAEITMPGKQKTIGGKIAKGSLQFVNKALEFPTDLHMVIKEPLKRAVFEASVKNGMVWAERNGLDINDPLVVNSIENAAYKRANYEIFQEENWLSKKFNGWKSKMDKEGNGGATGKFVADFMIPVSTVPTNIVKRIFSTSPVGLIRGGVQVTNAYRKGIENLTSEQADGIMRQLKQGTLGTALWMIGWYGAAHFGGLYSKYDPNKKRQEGELTSDQMEVNGQMIPKPVQHALPLEIIQTAATARHIYDNYRNNKGAGNFESITNAGLGSIGALAEHVPIISTAGLAIEAVGDPYKGEKLKEDMQRRFEPQILRETGVIGTKNNPRQKFIERNTKDGGLFKNDVKVYDQHGKERDISTEEFEKFKDKREQLITDRLNKLYDGKDATNIQLDNGKVVTKKYDEMTEKQLLSAIATIKTKAYKDAKASVFGRQSMSHEQRAADKKVNKIRQHFK